MYVLKFRCGAPQQVLTHHSVARTVVKYKRIVIIDPLPDDIFLEIFDLCLRDPTRYLVQRMRKWIVLVHVCQRWRRIIFASPRRLDLYLSCICGTPVRQNLVYWPPTFPLVIDYPGPVSSSNHTPDDDDNIVVALTHADRIHRINIYGTSELVKKVAAVMRKPFPVLTHLELKWSEEDIPGPLPFLPRRFLGESAPRLEYLYLSGVSFRSLHTLLWSARNLLTLRLDDILQSIPPETTVAALAVLTRLSTLSIDFDWEEPQPDRHLNHPMPTILPSLTEFHYKGHSAYLEGFLALINTPLVDNIWIQYFMEEIQVPQLSWFIGRTKNLKDAQFRRAYVNFYSDEVNIGLELDLPRREYQTKMTLTLLGPWSNIQVPYVVNVLDRLVGLFSNVDHLSTHGSCLEWRDMGDLDSIEWLQFLHLFPAVETLHLSGDVVPYIASALDDIAEEMLTEVVPALHLLWLDEEDRGGVDKRVGSMKRFLYLRQLSGRPVTVVNTEDEFDETLNRSTEAEGVSEMIE